MRNVLLDCEVFVLGATPAGVMAAVAAGRAGRRVVVADHHTHVGGMTASGLGKSDVRNRGAIGGLFLEFTRRVRDYYAATAGPDSEALRLSRDGYYYEPSVAERIFRAMMEETGRITLLLGHVIEKVKATAGRPESAALKRNSDGVEVRVEAGIFIDASYEGDLYALAGAEYRVGREGRSEYDEPHAGRIFLDYESFAILAGSTGEGDRRLQAYTYRLCLTDDPENSAPLREPPEGYDRARYLGYLDELREGRLGPPRVFREGHGYYPPHFNTILRAFSFTPIPNRKFDVNINPRPLAFPFPEENSGYAEASFAEREQICRHHRSLALGLLYFAQNDPAVPEAQRALARSYHLPKDEFVDNAHFPWQLYVREARRLHGLYTISEGDVSIVEGTGRTKIHPDSIATGEFPFDSFPVTKEASRGREVLEGYIGVLDEGTEPYHVPFRSLIPRTVDGVIVPVAASATHVAFSTLRMEPLWMALGQAAGTAAHLSLALAREPRELPTALLQRELLDAGEVISYFEDLPASHPACRPVQFWAAHGFFSSYAARPDAAVSGELLKLWLERAGEVFAGEIRAENISASPKAIDDRDEGAQAASPEGLESWLASRGTSGSSGPALRVGSAMTRGEVCSVLYEAYLRRFASRG